MLIKHYLITGMKYALIKEYMLVRDRIARHVASYGELKLLRCLLMRNQRTDKYYTEQIHLNRK